MANLLPALEGLNQLLIKQVEKKEKDTKKVVGAQLVSEYDKRLQTAKTSKEVSDINSWFLTETQKRDVPEVQQTGYYMLNNYLPRFQKEEEKAEKLDMIQQDALSFMDYYKNIKVGYNGQIITGDIVAKDLMKKNPTISSDDIMKHLGNLQIQEDSIIGTDPSTRQIVKTTSYSSKAGGELGKKTTSMNWSDKGKIIYIDNEGKIKGKDGVEISSTAGKYDEGIDTLVDSSEILSTKGGQQALNTVYELEQPEPVRGGGRGGYGGRGGKQPDPFKPFIQTDAKRKKGLVDLAKKTFGKYEVEGDGEQIDTIKRVNRWQEKYDELENYSENERDYAEDELISEFVAEYYSNRFSQSGVPAKGQTTGNGTQMGGLSSNIAQDVNKFKNYKTIVKNDGNVSIQFPEYSNQYYIVDEPTLRSSLIKQFQYRNLR